jgi:sporulation protein YlmC with PRC-barrel domain/uncharacterized protein YbjQ (UPF0145 family)
MYIVSPLLAGFVETVIASKKYGRSTGAISALLTFFLINGYGWFGPGWIFPKEPVTLSLITIIAIVLTIQAAFPILMNYVLFVVVMGTLTKIMRPLLELPSKISRKIPQNQEPGEVTPPADEIFLGELTIPLVSVHPINRGKINKYLGLVAGEAVAKEKESPGRLSSLLKIIEPVQLDDIDLGDGRKMALSRMLEEAESMGANAVEEVIFGYISMGGLQGSATIVTATGTAVIIQEGSFNPGEESEEGSISLTAEKINVSEGIEKVSGNPESISGTDNKINGKLKGKGRDKVSDNDLSNRIDHYINEKNNPSIKNWEIPIKFGFEKFETRYSKISRDVDEIDKKLEVYGEYENREFSEFYDSLTLVPKSDLGGMRIMKIKEEIIGKEVVDANGIMIGKVKDVEVSSETNKLEALIIGNDGIFGNLRGSKDDIIINYNSVLAMGDRILVKGEKD